MKVDDMSPRKSPLIVYRWTPRFQGHLSVKLLGVRRLGSQKVGGRVGGNHLQMKRFLGVWRFYMLRPRRRVVERQVVTLRISFVAREPQSMLRAVQRSSKVGTACP